MVKSLPNHPKVSGQLEIPLVSEFVPQSRQGGRDCGGMAWPSVLGSGFFFFAKVQLLRGHFRDVGRRAYRQVFRKYFAWREITDLGKAGLHLTGATGNDKVAGDDLTTHGPCCFQQLEMLVSLLWM